MKLSLRIDLGPRREALLARLALLVASNPLEAAYAVKLAAARAYISDRFGNTLLEEEAKLRGVSVLELCSTIIDRSISAAGQVQARELQRQQFAFRLKAAVSEQELDAIEAEMTAAGLPRPTPPLSVTNF